MSGAHWTRRRYLAQDERSGEMQRQLTAADALKPDSTVKCSQTLAKHEQTRFQVVVPRGQAEPLVEPQLPVGERRAAVGVMLPQ